MPRANASFGFDINGFEGGSGNRYIRVGKGMRHAMINIADLKGSSQVLAERLGEVGLPVGGSTSRALLERVEHLTDWQPVSAAERPGWFDDCYVMPDGQAFMPARHKAGVNILFTPEPRRCAKAGSLKAWRRKIAARLVGSPYAQFAVMLAFTAPILRFHGRSNNILFEFSGVSSVGKSSAMKLAASAWGPIDGASADRYWFSCNRTSNALERVAQQHSDAFLAGDDLQNYASDKGVRARAQELTHAIFRLSEGETRDRLTGPAVVNFRLAGMLSSNTSIVDLLGSAESKVNIATELRLITLPVTADKRSQIFENVPATFDGSREFVEELLLLARKHHGTAIRFFIERLVKFRDDNGASFERKIRERVKRFYEQVGIDPSDGLRGRAAEAFALVAIAGALAVKFKVLPSSYKPYEIAQECYRRHAAVALREAKIDEAIRAYANRSGIIDLDLGYPELTDAELREVAGFVKTGLRGQDADQRFLIVPEKRIYHLFPGWSELKKSTRLEGIILREGRRPSKQVKVRRGRKVRCCVFVIN